MADVTITEPSPRRVIVTMEYPSLVAKGLDVFLRTGVLHGRQAAVVIAEEPFIWEAIYEYYRTKKEGETRYIKDAAFPVVVMKDNGPAVQVALFTSPTSEEPRYERRRNVWAQMFPEETEETEYLVSEEEMKNELKREYFKIAGFKKLLETVLEEVKEAQTAASEFVSEEVETKGMVVGEIEFTRTAIKELLSFIDSLLAKYQSAIVKTFQRKTPEARIAWKKAFELLVEKFHVAEKDVEEVINAATEVADQKKLVTMITQVTLVPKEEKTSSVKIAASFLKTIWEKITDFFRNLYSKLISAKASLSEVDDVLERVTSLV